MFPIRVRIKDRGAVPRGMKKAFNAASKAAWRDTAEEFHRNYRDKRFTHDHAKEAGYAARKGELLPRDSRAFRNSYTGRKLQLHGHTRPLEFSGRTRKAVKFARISATSKAGKAAYAGASVFNFRPPKSRIRMSEEFRRITRREASELAVFYDRRLDHYLSAGEQ